MLSSFNPLPSLECNLIVPCKSVESGVWAMWEWRCWISASSGYVACYSGVRLQSIIKCSRGCNSYVFRAKEEGITCWIGIIARKYTIVEGKLGDGVVDRRGIKLFLKERGEKLYKILQVVLFDDVIFPWYILARKLLLRTFYSNDLKFSLGILYDLNSIKYCVISDRKLYDQRTLSLLLWNGNTYITISCTL